MPPPYAPRKSLVKPFLLTYNDAMNISNQLLNFIEQQHAIADFDSAVGLLIEHVDPHTDFRQLIGPFAKDDVSALSFIDRLRSEEDPENPVPCEYTLHLLFPPQ